MNKAEWKELYAAARLLLKGRFYHKQPFHRWGEERGQEMCFHLAFDHIRRHMHPSIYYALAGKSATATIYPPNARWKISANTKAFPVIHRRAV